MQNSDYQRIQAQVASLLDEKLHVEVPSEESDLFETGILDSQKFVELLLHIEQQFGTAIAIEDFEIENFRTTARIAALILSYKDAAQAVSDAGAAAVEPG